MNNGRSRLIAVAHADLLCAIFFFLSLAMGILNFLWPWLAPIMLLLAIILFVFDSNSFVRKCMIQILVFSLISALSSLIFGKWLASIEVISWLFKTIDWIIRSLIALFTLISGLQALNGKLFNPPIIGKLVNGICNALRVY